MLIVFADNFIKFTNEQPVFEVDCTTVGGGLSKVFETYPQLYVHLLDNQGAVLKQTALMLDDEFIYDVEAERLAVTDKSILAIGQIVPHGEGSGFDHAMNKVFSYFDPLGQRIWSGQQVTGIQGYGWTLPWLPDAVGEKRADIIVGYTMQVVGTIMSFWLPVIGTFVAMVGSVSCAAAEMEGLQQLQGIGLNNSAAYTFSGIRNTTASGTPFQLIYGTHRAGGQVLNIYTKLEKFKKQKTTITDNILYAQIALSEGEVESITNVEINKLPVNYYNAITTTPNPDYFRTGTRDQTPMIDFKELQSTSSYAKKITTLGEPIVPPGVTSDSIKPIYGIVSNNTLLLGPYVWKTI